MNYLTAACILAIIGAFVIGHIVGMWNGRRNGYSAGYAEGKRIGRDSEWNDRFISQAARERARHGKDGKFVAKPPLASPPPSRTTQPFVRNLRGELFDQR